MSHFAYSFCITLFHSLWQGALLLSLYVLLKKLFLNNSIPAERKNLLFAMAGSQLLLSIVTFVIYMARPEVIATNPINKLVNGFVPAIALVTATPFLLMAYLVVLCYKVRQTLLGWQHFNRLYQEGLQKPSLDLKLFAASTAHHFSIKRPVQVFLSSKVHTPVTFGVVKPVILLPVALINQISLQQAETLIIHELTHIKANDYLHNLLLIFTENIFFFNPFVLSLCKKIKLERELHCDTTVIHFKYSPVLYAQTLLQAEKLKQSMPVLELAAVSSKQQLLRRIQYFSSPANDSRKSKSILVPLLISSVILLFCGYSIFQLQGKRTKTAIGDLINLKTGNSESPAVFVNNKLPLIIPAKKADPVLRPAFVGSKPAKKMNDASIADNQFENNSMSLIPAGFSSDIVDKQVILQEESAGSKTSTLKVYNLVLDNGEWILKPDWMATSQVVTLDSLIKTGDSSGVKLLIQNQQ